MAPFSIVTAAVNDSDLRLFSVVFAGDEILAINGTALEGLRHAQAIGIFKAIKTGTVTLQVCRRIKKGQL